MNHSHFDIGSAWRIVPVAALFHGSRALNDLIAAAVCNVLVDCSELSTITARQLSALLEARRACANAGVSLRLLDASPAVIAFFDLVQVRELFHVEGSSQLTLGTAELAVAA
ncbi:anti-sigma factor antagonist (plasmid) [Azospirillum argentinense]|uniref:Anti-sigma factor antagonist n=1 Tax=Azospirillum argentinense TaxID=2970906 RepID=A0A4D8PFH6_9PROT|nr:STAS domain-containing protein [Azospirillum argentinense]QCN97403.1 anti-sigma factor antagonist [Azospirillum argentinense]